MVALLIDIGLDVGGLQQFGNLFTCDCALKTIIIKNQLAKSCLPFSLLANSFFVRGCTDYQFKRRSGHCANSDFLCNSIISLKIFHSYDFR